MAKFEMEDEPNLDQAEVKNTLDRRTRYEAKQMAAGYTRCIVRCHVDDVESIKAFATKLLIKRRRMDKDKPDARST